MIKSNIWLFCIYLFISVSALADTSEYIVQAGDMIKVELPGEDSFDSSFSVDREGNILIPEIGKIKVVGMYESELTEVIKESLQVIYRDLSGLQILVSKKQMIITVNGYVSSPGEYVLPATANIQMALQKAEGLRSGAQINKLRLKRDNKEIVFDYKSYLDSGDASILPKMQSLDELFVPASPIIGNVEMDFDPAKIPDAGDAARDSSAIKVFGEVMSPGSFSFREGKSIIDLLMRAGGVTRYAGVEQIRIITDSEPQLFNLKRYLETGDSNLLPSIQSGATVFVPIRVEEIKAGGNVVYIMGEVKKPGAFEGKEEATFMDILANAGGPTRYAESRQIRVIKANGSVIPFDLTAFTEGDSVVTPTIENGDAIFIPEKTEINEKSWLKVTPNRAVRVIGEVVKPGRFEWSDEMSLLDLIAHTGGPTSRADTATIEVLSPTPEGDTKVTVFNLDNFIKEGRSESELPQIYAGATIRVHDLPVDPTNNKFQWVRQSSDKSIYIFGQVGAPGRFKFDDNMHFLDILAAADGPTDKADLHNIRISHRDLPYAKVSKLNLAMYFETGDESMLPEVKTGDSIYIPEKQRLWLDQSKESTIRILGAINKPGRYRFSDNMTILDLIAQAAGTKGDAYIEKITIVNISCCRDQAKTFDLLDFSQTADVSKLPVLRAGDTVYIPYRSASVYHKVRSGLSDIFQIASVAALIGIL
jgi:protein involved in polysaccharide export with SLBB domain